MPIRLFFVFFFSGIFLHALPGQDYLEVNTAHRCIYHGTAMPDELYRFETSDSIEQLKDDILKKTAQIQNFEFICSNVPSVTAVVDKNKRYVLYSRKFFSTQPDLTLRLTMLAHEIGHHANGHTLKKEMPTESEEMEADEFAGYALCLTGVPAVLAEQVAAQLSLASGIDSADRKADIMRGFMRAEASLRNAEHAAWFEENVNEVIKNFPRFPFPTPTASAEANLDAYFTACATLADADKKISRALESAGYSSRRYLYVPDGFALVTRLEQFNRDGSSKSENHRWASKIARCEDFSAMCYLKSLFTAEPGYFRVFVFIVTPHTLTNSRRAVTRTEATEWLNEGANKLPPALGQLPFDRNTNVTALVYEFKVPEKDRQPVISNPSEILGKEHLRKSKITQYLKN